MCSSVDNIPNKIHTFKHYIFPDHPGKSFTVGVLRDFKKFVLVAVYNFSGFISTTFIKSEPAE